MCYKAQCYRPTDKAAVFVQPGEAEISLHPDGDLGSSSLLDADFQDRLLHDGRQELRVRFDIQTSDVLFDLTRLFVRRRAALPTGIDRIEMAFAQQLLEEDGINTHFVLKVGSGALVLHASYARDLIESMAALWRETSSEGGSYRLFLRKRPIQDVIFDFLTDSLRPVKKIWAREPVGELRAALDKGEITYLTTGHNGLARTPGLLSKVVGKASLPIRAYIHDLIPIQYPEFQRAGVGQALATYLLELAQNQSQFVANSHATAEELKSWLTAQGHNNVVRASYPPLQHVLGPTARHDVAEPPSFMVVGSVEPRKNHLLLLNVWRQMVEEKTTPMPHLIIAGHSGWLNNETRQVIEESSLIRPFLSVYSEMSDSELFEKMTTVRALLFPSFAEGLGIPLLEAQMLGTPCIASDIPVFREISGPSVRLLDPIDGRAWRTAIEEMSK